MNKPPYQRLINTTFYGFLLGLGFILLAIAVELIFNKIYTPSLKSLLSLFQNNKLIWIISSAPFVLGFTFYQLGLSRERFRKTSELLKNQNLVLMESNKTLDLFNYHVSHDLKTVLSNIHGLTNMARRRVQKGEIMQLEEICRRMEETVDNGRKTIEGFLELGKQSVQSSVTKKINIKKQIELLKRGFSEDIFTINFHRTDFDTILIDELTFNSVFTNLISNSIKYSKKEPIIDIELTQDSTYKYISFRDNGIGIDLERFSDVVFNPFQRIPNSLNQEGSGIGLYLIKTLLERQGILIKIESKLNEGTHFILYAPKEF